MFFLIHLRQLTLWACNTCSEVLGTIIIPHKSSQRALSGHTNLCVEELEPRLVPATITVDTLKDPNPAQMAMNGLSLRQAIELVDGILAPAMVPAANQKQIVGQLGTSDVIQFAAGLAGVMSVDPGQGDLPEYFRQ